MSFRMGNVGLIGCVAAVLGGNLSAIAVEQRSIADEKQGTKVARPPAAEPSDQTGLTPPVSPPSPPLPPGQPGQPGQHPPSIGGQLGSPDRPAVVRPGPEGPWGLGRPGPRRPDGGMVQPPFGMGMPGRGDPYADARNQDPEMAELESKDRELERQTQDLAQQLRRASRDQKEALKKQLHEAVEKHFVAREARRELQLQRLEAELQRMRESMKNRETLRDQIISRRVSELAGEQSDLDF